MNSHGEQRRFVRIAVDMERQQQCFFEERAPSVDGSVVSLLRCRGRREHRSDDRLGFACWWQVGQVALKLFPQDEDHAVGAPCLDLSGLDELIELRASYSGRGDGFVDPLGELPIGKPIFKMFGSGSHAEVLALRYGVRHGPAPKHQSHVRRRR